MMRFLFLLLFFLFSSQVSASDAALKRAEAFMQSNTHSDTFRAYNAYKNLYLHSVVKGDATLREKSLKGIVKSAKRLHIDVSKYEKELQGVVSKQSYHQPKPKPLKKTKRIEEVHVEPLHKLLSVSWQADTLILTFDKELKKEQIETFTLHDDAKKKYRYVFDIKNAMLLEAQTIKKENVDRIRIAQFNPQTLRIVIGHSIKATIKESINAQLLEIRITTPKTKKTFSEERSLPLRSTRNKVIVIDPGHGGKDPGAVGYRKYREKIVVFKIAKQLENILKSRGYKVYMTRKSDTFIKLSQRTKFANKKNANIFISIHANALSGKNAKKVHGIECYFLSPSRSKRAKNVAAKENSADMSDMNIYGKNSFLNFLNHHNILASNKLAIDLQRGMLGALNKKYKGVKDGGVREGPFWVLVGAQMPSVLVEVGFITHPKEARRLVSSSYRKTIARGLADGIERYFANN